MITLDGTAGTIAGLAAGGLPNGTVQQADLATGVAATGPAFSAYQSSAQSIPDAVFTKVTLTTELFDTASCYDTVNSRFTPTVPGYYWLVGSVGSNSSGSTYVCTQLRKNGTSVATGPQSSAAGPYYGITATALVYLNGTTDYAEVFCFQDGTGAVNSIANADTTFFQGFLARAA